MNKKRIGKLVLQIAGIAAAVMILLLVVVDAFSGGAIVDFSINFFVYLVYTMVWDKVTFFFLLFIPVLLIIWSAPWPLSTFRRRRPKSRRSEACG